MKTCLITGANAGIGKAAATQIAEAGFRLILGCRNQERGEKALEEIHQNSGSGDIELMIMDMASRESISNAAMTIHEKYKSLDVLIHNAADFDISRKKATYSPEGIETIWATNHIGPVLLTESLIGLLKASEQGRVLCVASKGLIMHPRLKVDLEDPEFKEKSFGVSRAYYQSKLAQVMYTYWLARKLAETSVTVNCIRVTNVKIDLDRYPDVSRLARFAYSLKSKYSISPEEMARTYTWLATSEEVKDYTGKYFSEKNKEVNSSSYSLQTDMQNELMTLSLRYIK